MSIEFVVKKIAKIFNSNLLNWTIPFAFQKKSLSLQNLEKDALASNPATNFKLNSKKREFTPLQQICHIFSNWRNKISNKFVGKCSYALLNNYDGQQTIKAVNNCFRRRKKNNVKLRVVELHHLARACTYTHVYDYFRTLFRVNNSMFEWIHTNFLRKSRKIKQIYVVKQEKSIIIFPSHQIRLLLFLDL